MQTQITYITTRGNEKSLVMTEQRRENLWRRGDTGYKVEGCNLYTYSYKGTGKTRLAGYVTNVHQF